MREIDIMQIKIKSWSTSACRVADICIMLVTLANICASGGRMFFMVAFVKIGGESGKLSAFLHKQINILTLS